MASFCSTITAVGIETITKALATGREVPLVRAAAGSGRFSDEKNQIAALVSPVSVEVNMSEKQFVESKPSYLMLQIYISNKNLTEAVYLRELMVYALDADGAEIPFAYAWLDGEDTDNFLPATERADGSSDTAHIHELQLLATDQVNAVVQIEVSGGNWVTAAQMETYALKKPKIDGKTGQFLQRTAAGTAWADVSVPPTFDNLLAYPGCKRITPKKSGSTWTERIVTKEGDLLRAQRVTVIASEGDITETYTFYEADGATVAAKYIVHSTRDGAETWTEDVTKEETT